MPGPPPKKNARRRNARPSWRQLPAGGRTGRAPAWPLSKPAKQETAVWAKLWKSPQAVAWEELGWTRVVARYARVLVRAEGKAVEAAVLSEVRQLEDRLGLSPMAMKRLQWEIAAGEVEEEQDGTVTDLAAYKQRTG